MKDIMDYVNTSLEGLPEDKYLYAFKKRIVNEITARANEITHTGITDEKVLSDIIMSQYPDIRGEFEKFRDDIDSKRNAKSRRRKTILGSAVFFGGLFLVFLLVSIITKNWHRSWIFLVNGICLYVAYMSIAAVMALSEKEGRFKPFSRALIAVSVFNFAVPIFLICAFLLRLRHPWLVFFFAIIAMLVADGIFLEKINNRFAIFFHLAYIVPAAVSLYIITGTMRIIPWSIGWLLIPASLLVILIIVAVRVSKHNNGNKEFEETEGDREWNAD